jgi:uncharacterized membrane protein YdcZ (DUF606 family)
MKVLPEEILVMCKEWMDHVVGVIFDLCLLLLLLEMSMGFQTLLTSKLGWYAYRGGLCNLKH